jgi:hypothetical protein
VSLSFDNQIISITGRGPEDFKKAMSFFFPRETDTVKGYAIDSKKGMVLFWSMPDSPRKTSKGGEIKALPYEMTFEAAVQFAWNWMETRDATNIRGEEPDHDGDNGKAWRVYNEDWTHVDNFWEALVGVRPIWAMYGK